MPASSLPLRIAVLGAGKIGSTFASHLARVGGHDVTVIARPGSVRLQQLERDSAIIDVKGEWSSVRVASMLDKQTPYDLVIVTLLAHQTDALLPALQRSEMHPVHVQHLSSGAPARCDWRRAMLLRHAVRASRTGWRRKAQSDNWRCRSEDHYEPATLGGRVQRRWIALCSRTRHASLAPLPRSTMCGVRKRVGSRRTARRRRLVGRSAGPGARRSRELYAYQEPRISRLSEVEKAH
jgi:hypothetical protein